MIEEYSAGSSKIQTGVSIIKDTPACTLIHLMFELYGSHEERCDKLAKIGQLLQALTLSDNFAQLPLAIEVLTQIATSGTRLEEIAQALIVDNNSQLKEREI